MLTDGVAKLGDFGCAVHSICMRKSKIGSIGYLSPEQLNHHFYNKKIDIWSMGIVTYELLFGNSPYEKEILDLLKKD
jgi:serine/threonine protein kinase